MMRLDICLSCWISTPDLVDEDLAEEILDAARGPAEKAGIQVEAGGSIGSRLSEPATESSELVGLTAAMIILTVVLGSLVAMGLPIVVAVIALFVRAVGHRSAGSRFRRSKHRTDRGNHDWPRCRHRLCALSGDAPQRPARQQNGGSRLHRPRRWRRRAVPSCSQGATVIIALLCLALANIPLVTAIGLASAIAVVIAVFRCSHIAARPSLSVVGGGINHLALAAFFATSYLDW